MNAIISLFEVRIRPAACLVLRSLLAVLLLPEPLIAAAQLPFAVPRSPAVPGSLDSAGHAAGREQAPTSPAGEKPNILIIMADDMGYSDLGSYGGEVETPVLDHLAEEGLRYRQFYNAARCCPSRAALMTGLYPHQAGMGWMAAADLGTPQYQGSINDQCITIAEALKPAGYNTYMTGKWHLTNERQIDGRVLDTWPAQRGFDRYFGIIPGGANYFTPTVYSNNHAYKAPDNFYLTNAISDTTVKFLEQHFDQPRKKPFFMYVAYTAPHWPLHALRKEIDKYKQRYLRGWDVIRGQRLEKQVENGLFPAGTAVHDRDPDVPAWKELPAEKQEEMAMRMAIYAAQIDIMDQGIGRIINALKAAGELENTLIFFLSDNGACAEFISNGESKAVDGSRNTFESYRINWANVSSAPFREYKHFTHEGGIATPLIVHWPAGIEPALQGTFVSEYGHITDLMATCIEVAGTGYPESYDGRELHPLAGKSLLPHFSGQTRHRGPVFWEHEANIALRDGKWKLVAKTPQGEEFDRRNLELYDMEDDPAETRNLAAKNPGLLNKMYDQWLAWGRSIGIFPLDTREYGARMRAYRRVVNGDFDDKLGGWNIPAGQTPEGKENPARTGPVVRLDTTGKLSGARSALLESRQREGMAMAWPFRAEKGERFRITLTTLAGGGKPATLHLRLEQPGENGRRIIDQQLSVPVIRKEFELNSLPVPEAGNYRIALYMEGDTGEQIWVDNLKISTL